MTDVQPTGEGFRVLVLGEPSSLFWDWETESTDGMQVVTDVLEGIHVAASNSYAVVAIDLRALEGRRRAVLQALRQHMRGKIVLLIQMVEEPLARRWMQPDAAGTKEVDDYLVCPASLSWLEALVNTPSLQVVAAQTSAVGQPNHSLEGRIRELERLATEDDLTGLKNRRYVWEFARQILEHAAGQQGRVTLLVYDIDNFKHYNDQYGHAMGDCILKEAAVLMRRCCRTHDVVGRIGGDEFAVVFWDDPQDSDMEASERRTAKVDHPREAMFVAKRFQATLKESELRELGPQGAGVLTISGGLASFPTDGVTIQELFEKADMALLEAKRSGKNRIYLVGQPPEIEP